MEGFGYVIYQGQKRYVSQEVLDFAGLENGVWLNRNEYWQLQAIDAEMIAAVRKLKKAANISS